ncbi:BTAD domain-containing putative transcriptional regulator [Nocardia takedensis]|uniref:BTAD domain-containing putative transcriptional regulator n=1 Tax=Nocardia takedensis TaxID=259390 RepID=UPI0009FE1E96
MWAVSNRPSGAGVDAERRVAVTGVRISVLGPVRVASADTAAEVGSGRQLALLVRLVAAGGRVVSTDRLIEDLWRGEPPPKALAALQVHVSNLRRFLEPDRAPRTPPRLLVSEAPGYALRLPPEAVDVWEFDALLAGGAADGRSLDRALDLWRGDPFGAYTDEQWAETEVSRLHALRLSAVERRAAAALADGEAQRVADLLPAECARHPAREELFRLLALAQYRLGRQADALATLRTLRAHLSEELGVDPGPAVRGLETDILAHSPALTLAPAPASEPRPAAPEPVAERREFAGRESESARLTRVAQTVRDSGLRLVWVVAEAGGGKTTFAETVAARLTARGWRVAVAHCPEVDGAPAAWAWRELLGGLGVGSEVDDPFEIARAVVAACRGHRDGVLLVVDDVHRADSATLQVLRQTIAWMRELPVLVVGAFRPSEAGAELAATAAALVATTADRVELAGLSDEGIRQVAAAAGLGDLDADTVEVLRARTEGNPLFVGELAKWIASHGIRDALTSMPDGIREVLLRRADRLPAEVGRMLRLLSVCGRGADIDTLLALWANAAAGEDELLDAVDTAVVAGLLRADADRVEFRHVLVRDAVYHSIPRLRRQRMHWRTLCLLESHPHPDLDELAFHAEHGASPATVGHALDLIEAAARARFEAGLRADSAPLWQAAVDLREGAGHAESEAAPRERDGLRAARCALVTALAHRGEVAQARAVRGRALAAAQRDGDPAAILEAATSWRTPRIWTTREQRSADPQMTEAVRAALPGADGADRVRLLVTAVFEFEGHDDAFALACAEQAVDLVADLSDVDAELTCAALNALVFVALGPDLHERLFELTERYLRAAEASGLTAHLAAAHYYRFLAHLGRTDLPAAAAEVGRALDTASSGRLGELVVVLSAFDAVLDVLRGDLDRAEAGYARLAAGLTAAGLANGAELGLVGEMIVGWFRGSLAHLVEPLALRYRTTPHTVAWMYAVALLDAGRTDAARAVAEAGHRVGRDFYWTASSAFRARALVRLGMREQAGALYAELLPRSGAVAGLDSASVALGPIDDLLADLAELLGEDAAAADHRARAAQVTAAVARGLTALDPR